MDIDSLSKHEYFMRYALKEAEKAFAKDEVPVGAIIVADDCIIARAHNQREMLLDPTAHAEMIAITQAATYLENWRLSGTTLYVTLEPCLMCIGAIIEARIDTLVFGAYDNKSVEYRSNFIHQSIYNQRFEVIEKILEYECRSILQEFFLNIRTNPTEGSKQIS